MGRDPRGKRQFPCRQWRTRRLGCGKRSWLPRRGAWVARPGRCRVSLLRFRHIYRSTSRRSARRAAPPDVRILLSSRLQLPPGTRPVPCRAPAGACLVKPGTAPPCADATESPRRGGGLSGGDWTVSEVRLVSIFAFTRQRPLARSRPPTRTYRCSAPGDAHKPGPRAVADSQCMGMPAAAVSHLTTARELKTHVGVFFFRKDSCVFVSLISTALETDRDGRACAAQLARPSRPLINPLTLPHDN
jgi:hypothetical protein